MVDGRDLITLLLCRTSEPPHDATVNRVKDRTERATRARMVASVIIGQSDPPIVMDWHCSDRHLGAGAGGVAGNARSPDTGRRSSATLPARPLVPAWKRIVTGRSIGWRYRRARNRIRTRGRRLARAARSVRTARISVANNYAKSCWNGHMRSSGDGARPASLPS